MFSNCKSLISLPNISKWNLTNVVNMSYLFSNCESLLSLPDLSRWDIFNNDYVQNLFENCFSLLIIPDINLIKNNNNETKKMNLLQNITKSKLKKNEIVNIIKIIDFKNYKLKKENKIKGTIKINLNEIYYFMKNNRNIIIYINDKKMNYNDFHISNILDKEEKYLFEIIFYESITNLNFYFERSKIISINLSEIDTSNIINMGKMFAGCNKLTEIIGLNNFNTSKVKNMARMFEFCFELEYLDLSFFDTSNVISM